MPPCGQAESCTKHYSFCFPPQNKYYTNIEGSTQKHIGLFCWNFPTYVKDSWVLTKVSNFAKQSVLETKAQCRSFYFHSCTAVRRKTQWQPTNGCLRTRLTSDLDFHLFQNYFSFVLSLNRFLMSVVVFAMFMVSPPAWSPETLAKGNGHVWGGVDIRWFLSRWWQAEKISTMWLQLGLAFNLYNWMSSSLFCPQRQIYLCLVAKKHPLGD